VDIRSQTALLAAIVGLALAISMLLRPNRTRDITAYAFLCFALAAHYLGEFLFTLTGHDFWTRVALATGSIIPVFAIGFFMEFLGTTPGGTRRGRTAAILGALAGCSVAVTPLFRIPVARVAAAVVTFAALTASLSLLLARRAATDARIERARLTYLCWGAAGAIIFSATDFLPRWDVSFPTLGPIATTLYLYFLAQTLTRLRLLDLHEVFGKIISLSAVAAILTLIYAVLVVWVGDRPGLFVFNTVVASYVILILIDPLRPKVESFFASKLFRERFEMIHRLTALRARVQSIIDVHEVARVVLDTLEETRRVTHASIYLMAEDRPGFRLLDYRGPVPTIFLDLAAARGLLFASASGQKAVLREYVERRHEELRANPPESKRLREELKRLSDITAAMAEMKAGITVPLSGGDRVIGFLNLHDERVPEAYASNEIAVVLEIAERLAIAVENSKLYERMKERDRLAALGEMAAGLAHEIRNPLGAIKGAAQVLDPSSAPGEHTELFKVIVEEVNRLNKVVSEFLDYARPLKQNFAPTDVNDVLTRTVKLFQGESVPANLDIRLELAEKLPKVMADPEQLKQVVLNLIINSVQAMPGGGTVVLSTARPDEATWRDFRSQPELVELRVRDNGKGIPDDERQNIFVPFFTTKEKGTGLGLAICQRIVKNHGGTIGVTPKTGPGAEFVIRLPAIPETETRLAPVEGTPSPDGTPSPETPPPPEVSTVVAQARESRRERRKRRRGLA
jgi:two-component system, NtrC family, sensor histidine kinase HydH